MDQLLYYRILSLILEYLLDCNKVLFLLERQPNKEQ